MKKLIFIWLLLTYCTLGFAQTRLGTPNITICESFGLKCSNPKLQEIPEPKRTEIARFLKDIPAKATRSMIETNLNRKPYDVSEHFSDINGKKVKVGLLNWMMTDQGKDEQDPHVDVLFFDGKAVQFRIWMGLRLDPGKHVEVSYAD
jgi:hypothetical protein